MDELSQAGQSTLHLILMLSAPAVLTATLVGLIVGLFQTVTQLQEQTLPFGLKLVAVCVVLGAFSSWYAAKLMVFGRTMLDLALGV